jgi:hypothetical protein
VAAAVFVAGFDFDAKHQSQSGHQVSVVAVRGRPGFFGLYDTTAPSYLP